MHCKLIQHSRRQLFLLPLDVPVVLPRLDFLLTVTIMVGRESTRPQKGTPVFVLLCSLRNEHLIYLVSNNVNGETRFLIQRAQREAEEQQCIDQGASIPPLCGVSQHNSSSCGCTQQWSACKGRNCDLMNIMELHGNDSLPPLVALFSPPAERVTHTVSGMHVEN